MHLEQVRAFRRAALHKEKKRVPKIASVFVASQDQFWQILEPKLEPKSFQNVYKIYLFKHWILFNAKPWFLQHLPFKNIIFAPPEPSENHQIPFRMTFFTPSKMWSHNWAAPESNFDEIWFQKGRKIVHGFLLLGVWAPLFWLSYSHMPPQRFFKDVSSKINVFASSGGAKLLSKSNKKHGTASVFQNIFEKVFNPIFEGCP